MELVSTFGQNSKWKTHYSNQITKDLANEHVIVAGWVHFLRDKGNMIFVHLRDAKGLLQIIAKKNRIGVDLFDKFKSLTLESVISVTGIVQEPCSSRLGPPEIE